MLKIKSKDKCRWDLVSLGEVMLRFDPGDDRIQNARNFRVWEGGGEYNVARNLSKVFKLDSAIVTALADNQVGRLVEDLVSQGGVDGSEILWRDTDGIGRNTRNGVYFMERGFGLRAPRGCSDRANTAVSQLIPGEVNWNRIFAEKGSRWFHTGGIFTGLSEGASQTALEAMRIARENGAVVSYDLNYRASLWHDRGGREASDALNAQMLEYADVVFGVEGFNSKLSDFDEQSFKRSAANMISRFPGLKAVVTTLRDVHSSNSHSLSGVCFAGEKVYKARNLNDQEVLDRVGSGDAFAAGFIFGLLSNMEFENSLNFGVVNSALSMTTPGDNSAALLDEIAAIAENKTGTLSR
ncbi:MAG: sugar kinase [Acidobacteria bacterium]|nr:sugar kinase [Acidobacteriota bacterium]